MRPRQLVSEVEEVGFPVIGLVGLNGAQLFASK